MSQTEKLIAAAQAIRPYLSDLLPSEEAAECDRQIATLLTQIESGQAQPTQLTALLTQAKSTREWLRCFIKGESPEEITRSISGYSGLAGDPTLQPAIKYVCPQADGCTEPWYREGNEPIPLCETHLVPLVPAQSLAQS
ncbi:MAG: hypothetical protein HC771_16200 [Synechococcales cyanobacterium CRU_2_2]|nr:hypothetical protein [Synechococcales cyanobacterium CRU_2_2]